MEDRLKAFITQAAGWPFAWGEHDCCLLAADWIAFTGRPDPAGAWRGRYRSAWGARRVLRALGGLAGAFAAGAEVAGLRRVQTARRGDVAVIGGLGERGRQDQGAIFLGRRWAAQGEQGLVVLEAEPLIVWGGHA